MTPLVHVLAILMQTGASAVDGGQAAAPTAPDVTLLPFHALRSSASLLADGAIQADLKAKQTSDGEISVASVTRVLRFCSALDAGSDGRSHETRKSPRLGLGLLRAKLGAPVDGARTVELEVGPLLVEPADPSEGAPASPAIWWPSGGHLRVAASEASPVAESAAGPICLDALSRLEPIVPQKPADQQRLLRRHRQAIDALRTMKDSPEEARTRAPVELIESPALATNLFELVTWFELADAAQASLRLRGELKAADAVVTDMRAYLKSIRAPGLDSLLAERVPPASDGFASLVLHESWPHDAWQLVEPALRLSASLDRTRREFLALAERIGRESGLAQEGIDELKARLATVAENMPPGFQWTKRFEDDCANHMRRAFQSGAEFGGAPRAPAFVPNDPVVAAMYARTVAFEVFGYAWSQPGAMPPSLQAERQTLLAQITAPIRSAIVDGSLVGPSGIDHGREALDLIDRFLASEDARWKPWIVFPPTPEVASAAARQQRETLDRLVRGFHESFDPDLPSSNRILWPWAVWDIDSSLSVDCWERASGSASRSPGRRPWIFPDTAPVFWDGYVPLRKW